MSKASERINQKKNCSEFKNGFNVSVLSTDSSLEYDSTESNASAGHKDNDKMSKKHTLKGSNSGGGKIYLQEGQKNFQIKLKTEVRISVISAEVAFVS